MEQDALWEEEKSAQALQRSGQCLLGYLAFWHLRGYFFTGTTNTKVTAHEPHISEVLALIRFSFSCFLTAYKIHTSRISGTAKHVKNLDQQLCLLKASKEKRFQNQLYVYIRIDYEPWNEKTIIVYTNRIKTNAQYNVQAWSPSANQYLWCLHHIQWKGMH